MLQTLLQFNKKCVIMHAMRQLSKSTLFDSVAIVKSGEIRVEIMIFSNC